MKGPTPIETLIRRAIPGDTDAERLHRVCILRIAHASENAEDAMGLMADWLENYLKDPDAYAAAEILHSFTQDLQRCLLTAAMELEKSLPELIELARKRKESHAVSGSTDSPPF